MSSLWILLCLLSWHLGSGFSIYGQNTGSESAAWNPNLTQHPVTTSDPLSQRGRGRQPISSEAYAILSFQPGLPPVHISFRYVFFFCSRMHCLFHFTPQTDMAGVLSSHGISLTHCCSFVLSPVSEQLAAHCTFSSISIPAFKSFLFTLKNKQQKRFGCHSFNYSHTRLQ